ncbi:MAG: DNA alkylation repair protein [Candidatus Paceibacterota bacterium]
MKKVIETKKQFSLKDELFNETKVKRLAREIKKAHPAFNANLFVRDVVDAFPGQELMQRLRHITAMLRRHLPREYPKALAVILKALPEPLDPKKTDNDFGDFIYGPYSYFVATYGCTEKHVEKSLKALAEITKRFSAEGALRDFLNAFPKETLVAVTAWSQDANYHVRRLASEGTRPNLPWAKKITVSHRKFLPLLDRLHSDPTRYVTRSVANHLNDIAKFDPETVLKLLKKWQRTDKQESKELAFITKHALRTLIKDGHPKALALLGYEECDVTAKQFRLANKTVTIGEALAFSFTLRSTSTKTQSLMVDYRIHFHKANGSLAPKVFKISSVDLQPGESKTFSKNHPLKPMSTRALYPGEHKLELQVNGKSLGTKTFTLSS